MVRIQNILCPVDFFPASVSAADFAIALARNHGARLILLHVVPPLPATPYDLPVNAEEMIESMAAASRVQLQKLVKRAESKQITVESIVQIGLVDLEIRAAAAKADFMVMGTHGRRGFEQWLMGSVTERLIRKLPLPLLLMSSAKAKAKAVPPIRRILVTTDFSEGSPNAIAYAFSIAQGFQAKVTLLHVLNDVDSDVRVQYREPLIRSIRTELEKLIPKGAQDWCEVTTLVETGVPYKEILETLKDARIDLLIMNIHGKGFLERALIGSTAERVVRGAACPVLLIPPMTAAKAARRRL